jgi:hypothetical protein
MIDGLENQNINQSNNQSNQFASQVNDPQLFDTMKKVIERNKEKVILDEKKEEEDEIEKQGEDKDLLPNKGGGLSKSVIQRRLNMKKLGEEFRNIFNKDNSNINDIRRCLIHLIIVVGVLNCCAWEIDCLFMNACYGENIEMKQWISILLFPIIILSIILLYILFSSINYLKRKIIMVSINIYLALSIFLIVLGIISLVRGTKYDDAQETFYSLTKNEQDYYENKDKLEKEYRKKMLTTGIIDLVLGAAGIIVFFMTLLFTSLLSKTTFDWRPPLRSHVRPQRIKKSIELYTQNYDSFLNVFRAENPNYQIDELEAKDAKNRFGGLKSTIAGMGPPRGGESINKEKKK